jgi:hypothetical protein
MAGKIFPDNRRSLFHYTSGDGLVGILKTNCLFASHSDFLNDSTECQVIRDLLTPLIEKEIESTTRALVQIGLLKKDVYNSYGGAFALGERLSSTDFKGLANSFIREVFASQGRHISALTGRQEVTDYIRPFLRSAPFMKHFGFREEKEYRIVAPCYRTIQVSEIATPEEFEQGNFNFKPMELRRRGDGTLIPYIELFKDVGRPLPIMSILVGPHSNQQHQKNALELFLEQRGLNIPVRVSRLPYREW